MNQDQLLGLLRNVLALGGGFALGHGYLSGEQVTLIGGIATAVVPVVWSYIANTDRAKLAAVAALPDVKKIVTTSMPVNSAVKDALTDPSQPKITPVS